MKLTYRGVAYDHNPPMLEVTESDVAYQYRGSSARYTYVRHVPIPQPAEHLSYRGVAYQTTRHGHIQQLQPQGQTLQPVTPRTTLANLRQKLLGRSKAAQARRELVKEATRLHQSNITRSLQHRIDVAKAQGNEVLLQQLESEMRQIV
ncbi:MAG: DUF4278 domain-containing protein [Cyanobacteria bacterium J06627_28]